MPDTINQVGASLSILRATLIDISVHYGLQILAAVAILLAGSFIGRHAGKALDAWLEKRGLDDGLRGLVLRIFRVVIFALSALVAAEKAGVPVTSLIAGIGVAGVGAGLALQGVLGNVFAGLTILFTRPFKVGQYVEVVGVHGLVAEVTLFSTTLIHPDTSRVIIPNRKIVGEILHNHGDRRQFELKIGVAYTTDLEAALSLAQATLRKDPRVLADPQPLVGVRELGDSAVVVSVRPWVSAADYESARLDLCRALLEAYRDAGVSLPFPQREVRLLGNG